MSGKPNKCQLSEADIEEQELEKKRKKDMAKYIGKNIHQYRINMNLTREQLAEKSHITSSHLYQLEMGNSIPSIITIALNCSYLAMELMLKNVNVLKI